MHGQWGSKGAACLRGHNAKDFASAYIGRPRMQKILHQTASNPINLFHLPSLRLKSFAFDDPLWAPLVGFITLTRLSVAIQG